MINNFDDLLEYLYVNELVDENLNWKEEKEETEEKEEESKVLIKDKKNY